MARQANMGGMHALKQFVQPVQFKAHTLGQLELKESQLEGAERSQTALNKAMAQLANNAGRPVLLELDGSELRVLNAASGEMLHRVPVQQIRCWAVGRENPRLAAACFTHRQNILFAHIPENLHLLHANLGLRTVPPYVMCSDVKGRQKMLPRRWPMHATGCSVNAGPTRCQAH